MRRSKVLISRNGFTLLEVLVVVAILALLAGLVAFGGSAVWNSQKKQTAANQLKVIADCIDRYANAWAPWTNVMAEGELGPARIQLVEVSNLGYPDFHPQRLFKQDVYVIRPAGFDMVLFEFDWLNNPDLVWDHAHISNECLAYCLLSDENGGPYIENNQLINMIVHDDEFYPSKDNSQLSNNTRLNRATILDPWGRPYRFFWTTASQETTTQQAPHGRWPVRGVRFPPGSITIAGGKAYFNNPDIRYADGYVLESAGPDGQFGNQWKSNPSADDVAFAADNVYIIRP